MTMDKILIALASSPVTKVGKEPFTRQSLPQRVFTAIWKVEAEVNNGGFSQYFWNESNESAHFVVQALELIGAPQTASICHRAIAAAFPQGLPLTSVAMQQAVHDLSQETRDKLYSLDLEFYSYPHDLTTLLFDYVSTHPEEFGAVPKPDDA